MPASIAFVAPAAVTPVRLLVGLAEAAVEREVGAALLTMKNWLLKHIPLYAYFLGYVAVQGCRRLLPPLYYAMPIGLLTIFYLVARLGWLRAGFLYQAWQMLDNASGFAFHVAGSFPGLEMQFWAIRS